MLPESPALTTSDFPHRDEWSKENLPDILFYITPPTSPYASQRVLPLFENGIPVRSERDVPIRDFEILPRHISVDVEGK